MFNLQNTKISILKDPNLKSHQYQKLLLKNYLMMRPIMMTRKLTMTVVMMRMIFFMILRMIKV